MTEHIFVSYRSEVEQKQLALRLAADLKNAGVNTWMDHLDGTGIRGSENWITALTRALNRTKALISVLSPEYFDSKYCLDELNHAYTNGRIIIPILVRDLDVVKADETKKDQIPFWLSNIQHVDFRGWRDEVFYSSAFQELITVIKQQVGEQLGAIPDPQVRYLNSLIAELEGKPGILQFVEMEAIAPTQEEVRPAPGTQLVWEAEFSVLTSHSAVEDWRASNVSIQTLYHVASEMSLFVLRGGPGSGKTTAIRKLALNAAHQSLQDPRLSPIPLLAYLPSWEDDASLLDFLASSWPFSKEVLDQRLQAGSVCLYLDGLNEMGAKGGSKARKLREWLSGNHRPARVIITCRTDSYVGELLMGDHIPVVTMQELDTQLIQKFVINYLGDENGKRLLKQLRLEDGDKSPFFELSRNPYLLSALIRIYIDSESSGELPRNTGLLFKKLTLLLWEREKRKQTTGWQPFVDAQASLSRIAYSMIDKSMPVEISVNWANRQLSTGFLGWWSNRADVFPLLRAAESATLLEIRGGNFKFYHQLVQEFFAATELQRTGVAKVLRRPTFRQQRRVAQKWDQVVIALCGIIDQPSNLIQTVNEYDPFLAAEAISSGIRIDSKIKTRLLSN